MKNCVKFCMYTSGGCHGHLDVLSKLALYQKWQVSNQGFLLTKWSIVNLKRGTLAPALGRGIDDQKEKQMETPCLEHTQDQSKQTLTRMKSHNCPHISHHLVFFKDHFVLMVLWSGSHLRFWPREQIGVVCNVSPSTLGDNTMIMIILHIIIIIILNYQM